MAQPPAWVRHAWPLHAVGSLGALLVLSACTSSAAEPASSPPPSRPGMGPLEALVYGTGLGSVDPSMPDAAAQLLSQVIERENLVAACMKDAGFEYTPQVPAMADITVDSTGIDPESREYAEQYGFGAVRQPQSFLGNLEYQLDASANLDYRTALSPAAQEAYDEALHGAVTDKSSNADGSVMQTRSGGCGDVADGAGHTVRDEAAAYLGSIADDGAFDELDAEWSRCMREAGFDYASPADAMTAFFDEYATTVLADGLEEPGEDDQLAAREVAAGVASWDCRDGMGYDARHRAIQDQLEQAWVNEHRAELDAWLADLDAQD